MIVRVLDGRLSRNYLIFYFLSTIIGTVVSLQMRKQSEKVHPNFNILLGDNFYFDGVENDNDYRFKVFLKIKIFKLKEKRDLIKK